MAPGDYTAVSSGTVTIDAGETTNTFMVATVNDLILEGDETFTVTLAASGALPDGVTLGTDTAIGTITDDDSATVSIAGAANATEGSSVTFTVNLTAQASSDVVLNWSTTDGTAMAPGDYTAASSRTVTIPANMTTATFMVTTVDDAIVEGDETFTVTLAASGTLPDGVTLGVATATGTITDDNSATVSIAGNANATEGSPVTFTVNLTAQASSDVVLNWSTADGTAMAPGDYTPMSSGTVTIAAGATTNTFTVATVEDTLVEGDETFTVTLAASGTLPDGVTLGVAMATGTITDDDSATVSIAGAANATEGSSVTFTVNLTAQASSDVVLNWSTTDGTARAPGDYTATSNGTVTIAAGATTNTFTVATVDDALVEGDETFTVTLAASGALPTGVTLGTTLTATGTITDGDMATVSISAGAAATEGSPVTFTVNLSTAADEAVNLSWTGAGGTATASTDYTAAGTVTIAAGATTNTFTVATVDDALVEGDETFTVTLAASGALPTGVTLGTTLTATGTITDGDMATVSISAGAAATEGSPVTFTVNLSTAADEAVNLNWTGADGTATASTDYTAVGTVTIPANMTTATLRVTTSNDALVEGDETFTVTLAASGALPPGVTLGTTLTATGTITDDDSATVSVAAANASEGSPVIFTVNLSAEASSDVVLNWSTTDGTAIAPGDYTAVSSRTVTIPANMTTATFTVTTVDDAIVEGDETFTVTIAGTSLPTGVTLGTATATGTINDDDSATVSIAGNANATEGSSVTFTVNLTAQASSDVVLNWSTTDGTAMAPGDYTPMSSGTVTIAAGATTNTFTVATVEDTLVEGDETFTVTITENTLPDGVTLGTPVTATGTITDGDMATVSISAGAAATEGSPVTFTVNLSTAADEAVNLNWTGAGGTATAGTDYTAAGTVTIAAGATTNTFTVATVDDALVEGDETFTVTIAASGALPTGVTLGTDTAIGTITDGDTATVSIAGAANANEGSSVTFTVNLTAQASSDVVLNWSTTDGTAMAPGDYTPMSSGTVTIAAGATTNTFTVATVDDALVEGDETFTVTLAASGTLPDGVTLGGAMATGTITDGDMATVSISAGVAATEGSPVTFTVNLSTAADEAVNLSWTGAGGTATAGTDYTAVGTVTIAAGATTNTFTVPTLDDTLIEGDETFTVTIAADGALPAGVTLGTTLTAIGTITDDDMATVSIANTSADEGAAVEFTVSLSAQAISDVVLGWSTTNGTAMAPGDYTAQTNGTVTIAAGATTNTFTVATVDDALVEGDETFTVTITENTLPASVSIGTTTATGTITDGDMATVSVANASATEGEAVEFTVSLSAQAISDVVLGWSTTNGTAMAPGDYTAQTNGTVTIAAGATTNTFTVTTVDDAIVEGNETFTVTITENTLPDGVTLGIAIATGTITDDGSATVSVAGDANATEGEDITFRVNLTAEASSDVVLNWSTTDGTAMAGADYTATSNGTVTIAAGETTNTFMVATVDDALVEGNETFTVTLAASGALPTGIALVTDTATGTITDGDTATVSIAGNANATEGSPVAFTVNLSTAADEAVVLNWTGAGGTATAGTDYTAAGTVTIPANMTTATFTVTTSNDGRVESDETFIVTIAASGSLPTGVTLRDTTATGTITNDDTAMVSVANASATEGEAVEFTVSLSAQASSDVVLNWSTADGTAIAPGDYTAVSSRTVTIPANMTTATFMVTTVDDAIVEGNETFTVTITENTLPDGVTLGIAIATGTITDDGSATVSVAGDANATEGEDITFRVNLSAQASSDVVLNWSTTDGTAMAGADYTATSNGTVTIAAGETTNTFMVATVDDALVEGNETFTVTLAASGALPTGIALVTDRATGTITDGDTATVSIAGNANATEGSPVAFTVNLSTAADEAVVLNWTGAGGTATAGTDYTAAGTVTIPANMTTATFTVTTSNDGRVESDETFIVTIAASGSLPTGVTLRDTTATGTITNDDTAMVSVANASATEGEAVEFTVSLSAQASSDVVLNWSTADDTAIAGTDYTAQTNGTVTIAAGATTNTFTVATVDDAIVEGNETFTVTITENTLPDGVTLGIAIATGTITDDGSATVSVAGDANATEGEDITFTANLSAQASSDVVLNWSTTDGTAIAPGDYTAVSSGTVTIAAGATTNTFTVATVEDTLVEGDETFTVTLAASGTLPGGVTLGDITATGTITDDDSATVSIANASATEGGTVEFTVSLSAAANADVVLNWSATDGTAMAGADYTETTGTVTIPANMATATFMVATVDDALAEGAEMFTVTLTASGSLPGGVTLGDTTATGTIIDDDSTSVSIANASASEGEAVEFTVSLSAQASSDVVLNWSTTDGTAIAPGDYTAVSSRTVTIPANMTTATFTVTTADDALVEGDETFTVAITGASLPTGVTLGVAMATGTINDDDSATVTIPADSVAVEGNQIGFTVITDNRVAASVDLRWTAAGGTATAGTDYTASGRFRLTANTVTTFFTVATVDDTLVEGDETFTVTIAADGALPAGVTLGTTLTAIGTITDDDMATVSIANTSADEDAAVEFTVSLSAQASSDVVLNWSTADDTAIAGTDYTAQTNGTVTIDAGETTDTFTVATTDDDLVEGDETFTVTIAGTSIADWGDPRNRHRHRHDQR